MTTASQDSTNFFSNFTNSVKSLFDRKDEDSTLESTTGSYSSDDYDFRFAKVSFEWTGVKPNCGLYFPHCEVLVDLTSLNIILEDFMSSNPQLFMNSFDEKCLRKEMPEMAVDYVNRVYGNYHLINGLLPSKTELNLQENMEIINFDDELVESQNTYCNQCSHDDWGNVEDLCDVCAIILKEPIVDQTDCKQCVHDDDWSDPCPLHCMVCVNLGHPCDDHRITDWEDYSIPDMDTFNSTDNLIIDDDLEKFFPDS